MGFKPAKQGSHSTLKPSFGQTLESATPSAGEARGGGSAPRGGLGARSQGLLAWNGLILGEAFLVGNRRRFGGDCNLQRCSSG